MKSNGISDTGHAFLWLLATAAIVATALYGCAAQQPIAFTPTPILDPPERAEIDDTGKKEDVKGTVKYIEPPVVLEESQRWRAFKDGAICFRPRGWRAIHHNLTEWPKTWKNQTGLIERHNKMNGQVQTKQDATPWWQIWKYEW